MLIAARKKRRHKKRRHRAHHVTYAFLLNVRSTDGYNRYSRN